ncbi:inactive peptidyl-prolyl cis-trans isomerase FKBP6 [Cololabis saira]|uniref:inactive peptidyl-prolyl cis-trans isomerase FKBP6 n=1 Tax=Cololabis saira TaxID=129043 RepID=UPI002AD35010|nr:inactive peptidyl-prolyl cis-trans isomerase FKBP6 [Cololabis saira]
MHANELTVTFLRSINQDGVVVRNTLTPFQQICQGMEDVLGDGGILKEIFLKGEGPPVPRNASVLLEYSGYLEYANKPFVTTVNFKHPKMLKLGRDVTMAGLELGLLTMTKGEHCRFLFQPQYAYGAMGCPPSIPAAASVLFEVRVLDFLDSGQMDAFTAMSLEEQSTVPLPGFLEVITTMRRFGNRCFDQKRFDNAKDHYKQAVRLLGKRKAQSSAERSSIKMALFPLYLNLSVTELRLESPAKALKHGQKALEMDSSNTKALFRCGQAYLELLDYENAQKCLTYAQLLCPFDRDINNLLRKVAICYKDNLDKEKSFYSKMFSKLND